MANLKRDNTLDHLLSKKLYERESNDLLRKLVIKKGLIDFTSNDYLGLASSKNLFRNILNKVDHLQLTNNGATGSRLLSGNSTYTEQVEARLAKIFNSESALIFNSGYTANLAVLSSLPQRNDTVIYDELAHACIKDGARLSLAKRLSFKHNDLNDLESKIKKSTGHIFIAVESIYSMDGDECPLKELITISEKYDATIILDEAHSTGVKGEAGSGLAVSVGLERKIGIRIYTFGKAMGIHGACVAGSNVLQNHLINFARPFIYTTAMSPHSIVAIDCCFDFLGENNHLQNLLEQKTLVYKNGIGDLPNCSSNSSAIQTVLLSGGNQSVKNAASELQKNGFDVRPILSPTVPSGSERLRICLHTFNTDTEIIDLTKQVRTISRKIFKDKNYLAP